MSLLEIDDMVESLCYSGKQEYYNVGEDGCWYKVENDAKLLNILATKLTSFDSRVISIYVDHLYVPNVIESQVGSCDVKILNEPLNDVVVDLLTKEPLEPLNNVPVEPFPPFHSFEPVEPFGLVEVEVENESIDSDERNSDTDNDESTDLEYFSESDYDVEDGDELFNANIDKDDEWGGLRDTKGSNVNDYCSDKN